MKPISLLTVAGGLLLTPYAFGQADTFTNAVDNDITLDGNWGSGTAPVFGGTLTDTRLNFNGTTTYSVAQDGTVIDIAASGGQNRALVIGNGSGNTGSLTITGGTLSVIDDAGNNTPVLIGAPGNDGAIDAALVLDGGNLTVTSGGGGNLPELSILFRGGTVGSNQATGTVTVNSGSTLTVDRIYMGEGNIDGGVDTWATSILNLNSGGTLAIRNVGSPDQSGFSQINLDGGTIQLIGNESDSSAIFASSIDEANMLSGGLTIDTNSFDGRIAEPMLDGGGGGGLTKNGDGILRLHADNTFTGTTTVNAGTLRLGRNDASGSLAGPLFFASGTTYSMCRNDGQVQSTFTGGQITTGFPAGGGDPLDVNFSAIPTPAPSRWTSPTPTPAPPRSLMESSLSPTTPRSETLRAALKSPAMAKALSC